MQSPPRLTGKSARPTSVSEPSGWGVSVIPHCNEQYGQCVATPAVTT